jgi:DNA-binding transcriptional MerR regulator
MPGNTIDDGLRIGELAERTGVTVRTLHHYDEIGLLSPSGRTDTGHRRYRDDEIRRLFAILALRQLGLSLADIGGALDHGGFSLRDAVMQQISDTERRIGDALELRRRLHRILGELDRSGEPSTQELMDAMEVIMLSDRYYSKEQREQLARGAEELGTDAIEQGQRDWAELLAQVRAERDAGTDVRDPLVQALARRSLELVERFTRGDAGIRQSLANMYANEDPSVVSRGMLDRELLEYLARAQAVIPEDGTAGPGSSKERDG